MRLKGIFKRVVALIALVFIVSSCIKAMTDPGRRLYKTLVRKSPWNIAELKVSLYASDSEEFPYWDTTLYNWGELKFIKFKSTDFNSDLIFSNPEYGILPLHNYITVTKDDKLYISFKNLYDAVYLDYGSGFANEEKGDRITITGKRYGWNPTPYNQGTFAFAPFLSESAHYQCDWVLETKE